ncbi:TetR family transcriptional regulator [Streptomyces alkaliphilus]|uniref:TetR family transcriptional regulator n=1 Tax=Streptomyces alkaliphilus TaxID=1472722 RepID=A0A7W3TF38_9ACTN|nr:TetR/AcrR family transcriptional regulator [Streptomyces alkaliphilus]MBB0245647.1 TetR family transcriptional regulator [Streptomyces alkaliphilus]
MTDTGSTRVRRGDTRQRIRDVALRLFAAHGYEKTSLREIAEEIGVTKAALYYHFKTKEDILVAIHDDFTGPIDELIAWGREQPRTVETAREILRRYSLALEDASDLFRFMQENAAVIRDLSLHERFKERSRVIARLISPPGAPLEERVRAVAALYTMHAGVFAIAQHLDEEVGSEERRLAVLRVAEEMVVRAAEKCGREAARTDGPDTGGSGSGGRGPAPG